MTTTFMSSAQSLVTSESVTEGHPDKICDQISDAVLDAILAEDADAHVACDCVVTADTAGLVFVTGEITTPACVSIPDIARQTVLNIGYDRPAYGFDGRTCEVMVCVKEQSSDIAHAVKTGAGDQGMMVGFACRETPEYMPLPIFLAHKICYRLAEVRKQGTLPYLGPDGKSQVTVEYSRGEPQRVDTIVVSAQHDPDTRCEEIEADLIEHVVKAAVPSELIDERTRCLINPGGPFVKGGPAADSGLTGRKVVVDTYGGVARHGGGCFSGKDPTKVDRSGAYMLRYIAKNLVAAEIADRMEVHVSYAIGRPCPTSIGVETFGTEKIPSQQIVELIRTNFDLRPAGIITELDLQRPIYKATAAYGHFGRTDIDAPWEGLDKVESLRAGARLG